MVATLATARWRGWHQFTVFIFEPVRNRFFVVLRSQFLIKLVVGGFCNPGATQSFLGLSHAQIQEHVELGHVCWDEHDLLNGAVAFYLLLQKASPPVAHHESLSQFKFISTLGSIRCADFQAFQPDPSGFPSDICLPMRMQMLLSRSLQNISFVLLQSRCQQLHSYKALVLQRAE